MRCPHCGNEVSPDEAFCGQCGAPNTPPAGATEMVSTPSPRSGLLNTYQINDPFAQQNTYNSGMQPPPNGGWQPPFPQSGTQPPLQQRTQSTPQQQEGFYQDATEAISVPPGTQGQSYPPGYQQPQQPFPPAPQFGGYPPPAAPGQYGFQPNAPAGPQMSPFQTGNYPGQGYPQQSQPFQGGQGYDGGMRGGLTPPPQKRRIGAGAIIASICLVLVLLAVVGLVTLYVVRGHNNPQASQAPSGQSATPTTAPTPTATPTLAPTATTVPTPTPTLVPTATPDAGFTFCGQLCTVNGFSTEYPQGWQTTRSGDGMSIQFANPTQPDEYATFRTPGTTSSSSGDIVNNDIQNNFARYNYQVVAQMSPVTIDGQAWSKEVISYQGDTQKEHVEVYGINYQGKAYIIELQASEAQFENVNAQYFVNMTGRFQFQ